ncbi:MAG: phosphodiesterase [Methanosaeta sp. PtaU1.Bin112]|nr:MAG: phosphodiesterase [Methanosaeta sp. PtaU1.Bin112]
MTRIIALSDTHLENESLPPAVAALAGSADLILHAGDFVSAKCHAALAALGRLEAVHGNSDSPELKRLLPERKVIEVEGIRIGLVHMASHGSDLVGAEMMAREMGVDVLVFGHVHRPLIEKGKHLLVCPGSTTLPRMSAPSVAELEIVEGNVRGKIIPVGSPACNYLKFAGELSKRNP